MRAYWPFLIAVVLCASGAAGAWAHGGGLDGHGCHHNRKAGGYHCHRGPLAGQSFGSKEEMLKQLKASGGSRQKSAPAKKIAHAEIPKTEGKKCSEFWIAANSAGCDVAVGRCQSWDRRDVKFI